MKYDFSKRKIKEYKRQFPHWGVMWYYVFLSMKYIGIGLFITGLIMSWKPGNDDLLYVYWMLSFAFFIGHSFVFSQVEIEKEESIKSSRKTDVNILKTIDEDVISDYLRRRKIDQLRNNQF